jgi:hypothetical protein
LFFTQCKHEEIRDVFFRIVPVAAAKYIIRQKENASKMKTGFQMQQHSVETAVSDTAHKKCEANSLYDENRRYR